MIAMRVNFTKDKGVPVEVDLIWHTNTWLTCLEHIYDSGERGDKIYWALKYIWIITCKYFDKTRDININIL